MRREIGWWRAVFNVGFVLVGIGLAAWGGLEVSRRHWNWQKTVRLQAEFPSVAGLEVGARVQFQGLDAGAVEAITPPRAPGGGVLVTMRLDERLRSLVRSDATARIGTQGIVGAKVLEIVPGEPGAPPLADGQSLASVRPRELSDLLEDASAALARIDEVAKSARVGLDEVNAIAGTIRRGEGTLGRLVNDDDAYERLVALSDRGESTLQDLSDNLSALKQTWPFTRYFDRRGFEDLDRVLYQPGAEREERMFSESDLFEPGRAILTEEGRSRLDEVAAWFKSLRRPASTEIVIAAFTDSAPSNDPGLARILTQEQAEAVKSYLMSKHKLHSTGWFMPSRRMAAVGFGTQPARQGVPARPSGPPRRIEIILFTPQA